MLTNKNILVWSFYTMDTGYEVVAKDLIHSLNKYHPDYIIEPVACLGDWQRNVKQRILLIRDCLESYKRPVLAVDCDSTFHAPLPDMPECDFACHVMDKGKWGQDVSKRAYSLMGGTLLFNYSSEVLALLERWHMASMKSVKWEQQILEGLVGFDKWSGTFNGPYRVRVLPERFCAIDRTMWGVNEAVIRHHQASRRLRKVINNDSRRIN